MSSKAPSLVRAAEARKLKQWTTPHQEAAKPDKKQLRQIRELMERNQE